MELPAIPTVGADVDDLIDFCMAWLCYPNCDSNDLAWDYNSDDQINLIDWSAHMNEFEDAFPKNNSRYILTDYMGSVVGVAKDNNVTEISYSAWGTPSYSGDIARLNILWNGYYYDSETDNYYLRNRYYSSLERKFVTNDPRGIVPDENWNNPFDILKQYDDGGLQVYSGGDPINGRDDWGLEKCTAYHYRANSGYGHEGLLINGNDYDFGPIFIDGNWFEQLWGTTYGLSPWPYNNDDLSDSDFKWKKKLTIRKTGSMNVGGRSIKCKCAKCSDIARCANEQSSDWNGSRFVIIGHSCRTFARSTKKKCCLTE